MILTIAGRVLKARSFIAILLLGLVATGAGAYITKPVYRSKAVLLYQDRGSSNPVVQRDAPSSRQVGLRLQDMLFSHGLLQKLIGEFSLYPGIVSRFGIVGAVDEMLKNDLRFNARDGYTFHIEFEAVTPDLAQLVTARASKLLIQAHTEASAQKTEETKSFLDGEKRRAEEELRKRETELALFSAQNPEAAAPVSPVRAVAISHDSAGPSSEALGLEMQALQLRERLNQLHARPASTSGKAGSGRDAEARMRAESEIAAAQRDLAEKQARYTEEYPGVKQAMIRVETAKVRLRRLEERAASGVPSPAPSPQETAYESSEVKMVRDQLALVEKQIRVARSRGRSSIPRPAPVEPPAELGRKRAEYIELEWRARESRERLSLLENRQFQAEMQSMLESQSKRGDLLVLDPAFRPAAPSRSLRLKVLLFGACVSMLSALALGLGLVLRDDRLYRAIDVKRYGLPTLLSEVPPP